MEILFNVINKSMKKKWRNSDFCRRKLPRMFIIMKTWFVLLFVCTMHLNASNLYSQQKKMDISMKNASLVDVFRYIRQNSDYTFVYDSDAVKQMKTVSLDMKNVAIEEILEQCFKGSPFVYLIEGNLVIVKEQKGEQQQAKSIRVKGFVYDMKKQPIPGVTVKIVFVNLYKEYTSLKSRELEELPRFVVMIWQPFMLLRSASLCLFRITLCMQRYDFVSYKTKVS